MFAFFYICLKFDKKLQNDLWWNCCLKLAIGIGTMWHVPILSYLLYLLNSIKWKHWTEFLKIMTENHCVEGLPNARFLINIWDQTRLIWLSFVILSNFLPTIFTWSTICGRAFKTLAEIERERKWVDNSIWEIVMRPDRRTIRRQFWSIADCSTLLTC